MPRPRFALSIASERSHEHERPRATWHSRCSEPRSEDALYGRKAHDGGGSNQHAALLETSRPHARGVLSFSYAPRAGGAYDSHHRRDRPERSRPTLSVMRPLANSTETCPTRVNARHVFRAGVRYQQARSVGKFASR